MTRNTFLKTLGSAISTVVPGVYTTEEVIAAVDSVRDRDDCRSRATDYACGLEDGAVSVVYEIGIATNQYPESRSNPYPEKGWATDQTDNSSMEMGEHVETVREEFGDRAALAVRSGYQRRKPRDLEVA